MALKPSSYKSYKILKMLANQKKLGKTIVLLAKNYPGGFAKSRHTERVVIKAWRKKTHDVLTFCCQIIGFYCLSLDSISFHYGTEFFPGVTAQIKKHISPDTKTHYFLLKGVSFLKFFWHCFYFVLPLSSFVVRGFYFL